MLQLWGRPRLQQLLLTMAPKWRSFLARLADLVRHAWVVLVEAISGFIRNDDFRQASSLAYCATLALIPALLLLTYLLGLVVGSSAKAMQRTSEFVGEVIPRFGDVILHEVSVLNRHAKGRGVLNLLVLLWSLMPLVGSLRSIVDTIFKAEPRRSIWITKGRDLLTALLFILGAATVAGMSVFLKFLKGLSLEVVPDGLGFAVPFAMTTLLLLGLLAVFTPPMKHRHLLVGALVTAGLWFLMRPAFTLFLVQNPGYGVTFGSFKSIFIIIIWIYYAQVALLFGVEVMAALHRDETVLIKRLMEGRRGLPRLGRQRFVLQVPRDRVLFAEGESGGEMFHLLRGSVAIRKGDRELARLGPGQFFGEMSFLLDQPRSATAVALEPCEFIIIHQQNIDALMREYPGLIRDMLTEMAGRLRETSAQPRVAGAN